MSGSTKHVSGFFDRLRLVADLDYSDTEQDQAYEAALARIDACVERVKAYGEGNGFHSQVVRDAIGERVGDLCARLGAARARLVDGIRGAAAGQGLDDADEGGVRGECGPDAVDSR